MGRDVLKFDNERHLTKQLDSIFSRNMDGKLKHGWYTEVEAGADAEKNEDNSDIVLAVDVQTKKDISPSNNSQKSWDSPHSNNMNDWSSSSCSQSVYRSDRADLGGQIGTSCIVQELVHNNVGELRIQTFSTGDRE